MPIAQYWHVGGYKYLQEYFELLDHKISIETKGGHNSHLSVGDFRDILLRICEHLVKLSSFFRPHEHFTVHENTRMAI